MVSSNSISLTYENVKTQQPCLFSKEERLLSFVFYDYLKDNKSNFILSVAIL